MKKAFLTALVVVLVLVVTASTQKSTTKSSKFKERKEKDPLPGLRLVKLRSDGAGPGVTG